MFRLLEETSNQIADESDVLTVSDINSGMALCCYFVCASPFCRLFTFHLRLTTFKMSPLLCRRYCMATYQYCLSTLYDYSRISTVSFHHSLPYFPPLFPPPPSTKWRRDREEATNMLNHHWECSRLSIFYFVYYSYKSFY
jgi:hypothetical protein